MGSISSRTKHFLIVLNINYMSSRLVHALLYVGLKIHLLNIYIHIKCQSMSSDSNVHDNQHADEDQETKPDHQAINNQVNQYFQNIQYADDVQGVDVSVNAFEDVDLSSLNNDFQIDPSLTNNDTHNDDKEDENITAAAAAVAAYQQQVQKQQQEEQRQRDQQVQQSTRFQDNDPAQIREHVSKVGASVSRKISPEHQQPPIIIRDQQQPLQGPSFKTQEKIVSKRSSPSIISDKNPKGPPLRTIPIPSSGTTTTPTISAAKRPLNLTDKPIVRNDPVTTKTSSNQQSTNAPFRLLDVLPGMDPKRMCRFCGKTFAHPGSLGRHLDNRKGSPLHPADQIEQLRANVARRGNPEVVKARRAERARAYNRRDYVKAKNRERRKQQSKIYRAREVSQLQFYKKLSVPSLPAHPSFPRMVLFFLPPSAWPHDPPTFQTYEILSSWLLRNEDVSMKLPLLISNSATAKSGGSYQEKLKTGFDNWLTLSNEGKKDMWIREQRLCAQEALGKLTLFDFAVKEKWAMKLSNDKKLELAQLKLQKEEENDSKGNNTDSDSDSNSDSGSNSNSNSEESEEDEDYGGTSANFDTDHQAENDSETQTRAKKDEILGDSIDTRFYKPDNEDVDMEVNADEGENKAHEDQEEDVKVELEEADLAAVAAAAAAVVNQQQQEGDSQQNHQR